MTQTTTPAQLFADPLDPIRQPRSMRGPAQQSIASGAAFDKVLQSELDAVEPASHEPGSKPLSETDQEAQPDSEPENKPEAASKTDPKQESPSSTDSQQGSGSDLPNSSEDGATNPALPDSATRSDSSDTDTGSQTPRDPEVSEQPGSPVEADNQDPRPITRDSLREESESKHRFEALHGKRAAMLRWDSVGVELTRAAEIDLAEQSAAKLTSREGTPRAQARTPEQPNSLIDPVKTEAMPPKAHPFMAKPEAMQAGDTQEPSVNASSGTRATMPGADQAPTQAEASVKPMPAHVLSAESKLTEKSKQGSLTRSTRSDLIARLGSITNGVRSITSTLRGSNAVEGVSKSILRSDRQQRAQASKAPKGRDQSATLRQVQQGLAKLIKSSGGQSTIRLTPHSLGEITIRLDIKEGVASAKLTASNEVARSLLESGLKELRAAIESRGVRVERLAVDPIISKGLAEPIQSEVREDPQTSRTSDGSPFDSRPEADSRGGNPEDQGHHPGQGRPDDPQTMASTRSDEAKSSDSFDEPTRFDQGWIRLDTVA